MAMTWREIDLAWRARSDWDWNQTANLMACVYNIRQRGKGDTKHFKATDFYQPLCDEQKPRPKFSKGNRLTIGLLRALKGKMFQN